MFQIFLFLILVNIVKGNTSGNYPGKTFEFTDYDQEIRLPGMTDEIGNSIGPQFGFASDIYGDWIVGGTANNFVVLYKLNATNQYVREQKIESKGGIVTRLFNNTLVIGGHSTNTYVFENQNDIWTEVAVLPTDSYCGDPNYHPCDTIDGTDDGKYLTVGGPGMSSNAGAFRIYERVGDTWANTPITTSFGGTSGSRFGEASCISGNGNYSAACAPGPQGNGSPNTDYCKVYKRDGTTWTLYDTLTKALDAVPGQTSAGDNNYNDFGSSCEFNYDGDTLFIQHPVTSGNTPKVLVFNRDDDTDTYERVTFIGHVYSSNDFGFRLRWDELGKRLFLGDPLDNTVKTGASGGTNYGGKIWIFYDLGGNNWEPQEFVMAASSPTSNDRCGFSIGVYQDKVVTGCRYWDEISPDLTVATVAGRLVTWDTVPAYPTPAPTQSPTTPAPTPSPYIEVGKAQINFNVANPDTRKKVAKDSITDVKTKFSNPESLFIDVKTVETSTIDPQILTDVANETLFKESFAAARGCNPGECIVTIDSGAGRRLLGRRNLQQDYTVEIEFTFSEEDYASFTDLNTTLGDPAFITALANELGVDEEDLDITATGGTVTIEVTLTATVTEDPSGTDSLEDLQEVQNSLNNATSILVQQLGDPEDGVQTVELDLCGTRDCNGFGDSDAPGTDENGCNTETGVCVCTVESERWGINCETECECFNGGACTNGLCQCEYPFYGLRCHLNKTLECGSCNS